MSIISLITFKEILLRAQRVEIRQLLNVESK